MPKGISNVLEIVYRLMIILTCLIAYFNVSNFSKYGKLILTLLILTLFIELISGYLDHIGKTGAINYLYLGYALIENIFFSFIFISSAQRFTLFLTILAIVIFAILIFYFIYTPKYLLISRVILVQGVWMIFLTIGYFYGILAQDEYINLFDLPLFWIAAGLFQYFVTTLVLHKTIGFLYDIDNNLADKTFVWINSISNIIMYCLFSFAYLCQTSIKKKDYFL
jgi:hypothetical protein